MSLFNRSSETHALNLLKLDHQHMDRLFKDYHASGNPVERARLAGEICQALWIHAEMEESVLYPQALNALDENDDSLVREAAVEHGTLKGLIARICESDVDDAMFDAHVCVLNEYVRHHVREEEGELFPKLERSYLDLEAIGLELLQVKQRLERGGYSVAMMQSGDVDLLIVSANSGLAHSA